MAAADEGTKVGGEFLGDNPWGRAPGKGAIGGGVRAPREAGDEAVRKSLGGGELVVGGEAEEPRCSILNS